MMVNELNNGHAPWQSTIPQQMPWMSSYGSNPSSMQFGQLPVTAANNPLIMMPNINDSHNISYQQHPSMACYPTATTLTSPVTVCPTTLVSRSLFTTGLPNSNCVTTTTQSYPAPQNLFQPDYNTPASLTHLPYEKAFVAPNTSDQPHKRSSVEMEDDQIKTDEPPTKQLLSENKLFQQFGSLHIDGNLKDNSSINKQSEFDSDDDLEDDGGIKIPEKNNQQGREELNRYVYLLFKDKETHGNGLFLPTSGNTLDRLAREERDKLSKAIVLWNPPINNLFNNNNEDYDSDDEEFKYTDHKDFLRTPLTNDDSVIITEVTDDLDRNSNTEARVERTTFVDDDCMLE